MARCLVCVKRGRLENTLKSGGWRVRRSVGTGRGEVIQHRPDHADIAGAAADMASSMTRRPRQRTKSRRPHRKEKHLIDNIGQY